MRFIIIITTLLICSTTFSQCIEVTKHTDPCASTTCPQYYFPDVSNNCACIEDIIRNNLTASNVIKYDALPPQHSMQISQAEATDIMNGNMNISNNTIGGGVFPPANNSGMTVTAASNVADASNHYWVIVAVHTNGADQSLSKYMQFMYSDGANTTAIGAPIFQDGGNQLLYYVFRDPLLVPEPLFAYSVESPAKPVRLETGTSTYGRANSYLSSTVTQQTGRISFLLGYKSTQQWLP